MFAIILIYSASYLVLYVRICEHKKTTRKIEENKRETNKDGTKTEKVSTHTHLLTEREKERERKKERERERENQNVLLNRKIWDNKATIGALVIAQKRDNLIYEFNRKYAPVEANVKCEVCLKRNARSDFFRAYF